MSNTSDIKEALDSADQAEALTRTLGEPTPRGLRWTAITLAAEIRRLSQPLRGGDDLRFSDLREKNVQRCEAHYHPVAAWSLTDWLTCAAGELGELASIIKNLRRLETEPQRNGHEIPIPSLLQLALGDEAADVVIYLDLLCARAGVDLGAAVRRKFNRVSRERLGSDIVLEER